MLKTRTKRFSSKKNWRTLQKSLVDLGNASIRDLGQVPLVKLVMKGAWMT